MSFPTPTTSAAALLARAQARFQASVSRTATAVADARARLDDGADGVESLAQLEAELRRVQGWAASFGQRELKRQSGQLAARVRRWAEDPDLDRDERAAIMLGGAERLAVLATEPPARALAVAAPRSVSAPVSAPEPEPVEEQSEPDPAPPVAPAPPVLPAPVQETWVEAPDAIVIQDDPRMARLLVFALEQARLRVTSFDSGTAALDALRRMRAGPGAPLVILDVELPDIDGHDVHETLRAERPGMFSFVFTAGPFSDGERMRAMKAGALDYVMRPITLRMLLEKIPRWLAPDTAPPAPPAERRPPVIVGRRRAVGA